MSAPPGRPSPGHHWVGDGAEEEESGAAGALARRWDAEGAQQRRHPTAFGSAVEPPPVAMATASTASFSVLISPRGCASALDFSGSEEGKQSVHSAACKDILGIPEPKKGASSAAEMLDPIVAHEMR
uniref:Uncharacterized protein n=1 Tax=Sphaerodactylus townsendi TaxID=933632 RepID=A0ACB8G6I2_9SAUR